MRIDRAVRLEPSGLPVIPTDKPGCKSASVPLPSCSIRSSSASCTSLRPVLVEILRVSPFTASTVPLTVDGTAALGCAVATGAMVAAGGDVGGLDCGDVQPTSAASTQMAPTRDQTLWAMHPPTCGVAQCSHRKSDGMRSAKKSFVGLAAALVIQLERHS